MQVIICRIMGNLDIMTSAGMATAERMAAKVRGVWHEWLFERSYQRKTLYSGCYLARWYALSDTCMALIM